MEPTVPWKINRSGTTLPAAVEPPQKRPPAKLPSYVKQIIAGTAGGIAVTYVGHPFDTLKVLLQTQPPGGQTYSGLLDCFQKTVKTDGLKGLYKGVASPLAGQMFFRAGLFSAYAKAKEYVQTSPERPWSYCIAGSLGWTAASLAEGPIDFYKSQWQKQLVQARTPGFKPEFVKMRDCVRATITHNGVRGPYQGLSATLVRNIPYAAIYFGIFENGKLLGGKLNGTGTPSNLDTLAAGGMAGLVGWSVIYPTDVVKSAMQTDSIVRKARKYPTMISTAKQLYAEGGWRRFYKGLSPCLLRSVPANAVMLWTVDTTGELLKSV